MKITTCKVNRLSEPLGFALYDPAFSWIVEDAAGRQQSARIVVTSGGKTVRDTGWTDLDPHAAYLGRALSPRTRYEWTVAVRADDGSEAESGPHFFETGKSNIANDIGEGERTRVRYPLFPVGKGIGEFVEPVDCRLFFVREEIEVLFAHLPFFPYEVISVEFLRHFKIFTGKLPQNFQTIVHGSSSFPGQFNAFDSLQNALHATPRTVYLILVGAEHVAALAAYQPQMVAATGAGGGIIQQFGDLLLKLQDGKLDVGRAKEVVLAVRRKR